MARIALAVLAILLVWRPTKADERPAPAVRAAVHYDLAVTVDVDHRRLDGRTIIRVDNPTAAPLTDLYLWRYPARLARRSPELNDYNFYWIYPRRFNPAGMDLTSVSTSLGPATVDVQDHPRAGRGTLVRVRLPRPLAPGASASLDVAFAVAIPERYGPFGCLDNRCVLGGGYHPMLAALSKDGFDLSAPPARASYSLAVTVPRVSDVIVNGVLTPVARGATHKVELGEVEAAALVVGRPSYLTYRAVERGVTIELHAAGPPPLPSPPDAVLPYMPADRVAKILGTAKEAIDLLAEIGEPMPAGETIRLVAATSRLELARAMPGFTLVAEQLFDIFPAQRFLKFHEFQLARAIFDEVARRRLGPREVPADLAWSPDVVAWYLVDLYTLRSYRKEEFARQVLSWVSFIPAIDRILYAPQIPFATAYFNSLDNPDPLRDSLRQFSSDRPPGKTIFEKLRDLLGEEMTPLVRRALHGTPVRAAAAAVHDGSLDWFWSQWLGPYPAVDYRFRDVRCTRRAPRSVHCMAFVEKRGDAPPVEPVEVMARDRNGFSETLRWDGHGREHLYEFELTAPLSVIEIDPRGRLVEDLPGSNDDLRAGDRQPGRLKFVYNNFGGLVNFQTLAVDLSLDFTLSRIFDLKNATRFYLFHNESTTIGLTTAYTRAFGRKVTPARLTSAITSSLTASRIDPAFGRALGGVATPGTQLSASVGFAFDDRLYIWEPLRALDGFAQVGYTLTLLDVGTALSQATVSGGWEQLLPIADGQGVALLLSGAATFGDLRIAKQMLSSGAPFGLRGYESDELLGRARAIARAEYRHVFVHDLDINLLYAIYVRGVGGGAFVEGAITTPCGSYDLREKGLAADVGYSLRLFGDWFGVSQTTFNIDIAVPLVRHDQQCFGPLVPASARAPVGFFLFFGPPW